MPNASKNGQLLPETVLNIFKFGVNKCLKAYPSKTEVKPPFFFGSKNETGCGFTHETDWNYETSFFSQKQAKNSCFYTKISELLRVKLVKSVSQFHETGSVS